MRIMIADADAVRAKGFSEACLAHDHRVDRVTHGAAALELALDRLPDVVICPIDLPVIDGSRVAEILRSNPRTRGVSFLFLVKDELDAPLAMDPRDASLVAPWPLDQVLEHINAVLERSARLGEARPDAEMEGKLSQITAADLLQLFHMNRKTGVVRLFHDGLPGSASIVLRGGQVIDATVPLEDGGSVVAEKALFRIFTWTEGRFEFLSGAAPESGRIRKPMRALLLEGMRQLDEWKQQRKSFPSLDVRLRLRVLPGKIPAKIHPLTREVIEAVGAYGRVSDIVDQCDFPDSQVLRVLADLMQREAIERDPSRDPGPNDDSDLDHGLFAPTQVRRLREWVTSQPSQSGSLLKVLALGADVGMIQTFYSVLLECSDFRSNPRLLRDPERVRAVATLGQLHLDEGLDLRVLALPADPAYGALWEVAAHGMLGVILLARAPDGAPLTALEPAFEWFAQRGSRPVMYLVPEQARQPDRPDNAKATVASLAGGRVFVLPAPPDPERVPVLRNLFARLVP